ncbi:flagellin [Cytobacillus firmus]|uniref:flagellin N-terminal helical domain-containing protein n=1 Tax=Cytobacillus firmus TaxID=1399 RepID=UPI0018CE700D|nr:flagellin [Cytobacillus firmus]MBG9548642.1 hypothetical protein [Cytobacillus firmus]MBG9603153.1 hypothetical protein [Cytobacillus firmus]MDD9310244.1 flagellin [Cytobacillus firmus]MED1938986.1 flagellin [Cytobacillus firmus]
MIINNNITALHSLRILNEKQQIKSSVSEKLSSGLRVNKAADDSAGLAISEKMRAQIRGLQQAQRNIQDSISLIQTAEGGLASIENPPLQRLRELAVQAANDTLTDTDRNELQKEAEQIKSNINEIANQTHFNGISLLKGKSISLHTEVIKEAGVEWEIFQSGSTEIINGIQSFKGQYIAVGENGNILSSSDGENWSISNIGGNENLYDVITNGKQLVAFGDTGSLYTSNDGISWSSQTFTTDGVWNQPQLQLLDGMWDGNQYLIAADSGFMINSSDGFNWTFSKTDAIQNYDVAYNGNVYVAVGRPGTVHTSSDGLTWTRQNSNTINDLKSIVWHDSKFIAVGESGTVITSTDGMAWTEQSLDAAVLQSIVSAGEKVIAVGYNTVGGKSIFTSSDGLNWETVEEIEGKRILDITYNSGNDEFLAVTYHGEVLRSKSLTQTSTQENYQSLNFQIGSNAQQSLNIELSDVRTSSLRIDQVDLSSRNSAENAISLLDKALETVSAERSKFGAYQNRLEHALNNSSNYEENLIASESRIRDMDLAKQVMESTKLDILLQSSQAMLAQANKQPENILQLLG